MLEGLNKDTLEELYLTMTDKKIAGLYGVGRTTITKYRSTFGIPTNNRTRGTELKGASLVINMLYFMGFDIKQLERPYNPVSTCMCGDSIIKIFSSRINNERFCFDIDYKGIKDKTAITLKDGTSRLDHHNLYDYFILCGIVDDNISHHWIIPSINIPLGRNAISTRLLYAGSRTSIYDNYYEKWDYLNKKGTAN